MPTLDIAGNTVYRLCQPPPKRRTNGRTDYPSVRPSISQMEFETNGRTNRRRESNLEHLSLKMLHLEAIILMNFLRIDQTSCIY